MHIYITTQSTLKIYVDSNDTLILLEVDNTIMSAGWICITINNSRL